MISANALATEPVALPAASDPELSPLPAYKPDGSSPQGSFANVMGQTMGGEDPPSTTPSAPSSAKLPKDSKDDKKDTDEKKDASTVQSSLASAAMAVGPPPPPPTMTTKSPATTTVPKVAPVTDKTVSDMPISKVITAPSGFVQTSSATKDASAAVAEPVVPKAAPEAAPKPIPGEVPQIKPVPEGRVTPEPKDKSSGNVPAKAAALDSPKEVQPAPHEQNQVATVAPKPVQPLPAGTVGTGTAKQAITMKLQEKVEGSSQTAEKNLQGGNYLPNNGKGDGAESSPRGATATVAPLGRASQAAAATTNAPLSALGAVSPENSRPVGGGTQVESVRPAQMNQVIADVTDAAVSFKRAGAGSVDVNLRPDSSTEISLHLSLNNGQVEVAARLERGSFDSLNTHWGDLQQSLAQQGIRVGQLEHSSLNSNLQGNQNHNNQTASSQTTQQEFGGREQRSTGRATETSEDPSQARTSAEPQRANSRNSATATPRGWEMWA